MPPPKVNGKRILVAEDERGVREVLQFLLRMDGHTVILSANGQEALEQYRNDRFDLVITDYAMPIMPGNELAVRIKQMTPGQPILMITAFPEKVGQPDNPVDAILQKPFGCDELRGVMAELLGK